LSNEDDKALATKSRPVSTYRQYLCTVPGPACLPCLQPRPRPILPLVLPSTSLPTNAAGGLKQEDANPSEVACLAPVVIPYDSYAGGLRFNCQHTYCAVPTYSKLRACGRTRTKPKLSCEGQSKVSVTPSDFKR